MKLSLKNLNYLNQKKKDLNYSLSSLLQSRIRLTHFSIVHLLINYMHNVNPSLSLSLKMFDLPSPHQIGYSSKEMEGDEWRW